MKKLYTRTFWTCVLVSALMHTAPGAAQVAPAASASQLSAAQDGVAARDFSGVLSFDRIGADGLPAGWDAMTPGAAFADSINRRGAPFALRMQLEAGGPPSSIATLAVPIDFMGSYVEIRGWLKTENVQQFAGLWMRQEGPGGTLQFDNMNRQGLKGTTEWKSYSIRLPLNPRARTLYLGTLLVGTGTAWADDIEILVDGKPLAAATRRVVNGDGVYSDTEFNQGSRIAKQSLTPQQTQNLALLGKVWGFVKYHHPAVTSGKLNWDYELFRVMPAVLAADSREAATRAISTWLDRIGAPEPCSPCVQPASTAHLQPDIDWTRDPSLGNRLTGQLQQIHTARRLTATQYYVGRTQTGNGDFGNEEVYSPAVAQDAGHRMLALFRFWNIVEYWFPYRDVIGEEWDGVLTEFIPVLMEAEARDEYRLALMKLSARIHDTHANTWGELALRPPTGAAQLPVRVRFVEGKAVVTEYFDDSLGRASGLQPGDIIERIEGESVDSLVVARRPFYAASNEPTRLRDMARSLTRGAPGPVALDVVRDGRRLEITANRVAASMLNQERAGVHDLPGETFQMLSDDVAYLKLSSVKNADMASYMTRAANAKVLVVDIRNYPSEFVPFNLGGRLMTTSTPFALITRPDHSNPGAFIWTPPVTIAPIAPQFGGKVVVLVDEMSQSQAEYTAMALRAAPNTTVVGSTTAGADGNVSDIPLPGGVKSMISGLGIFYPDRSPTQRIGIVPDLFVEPTIAGIKAGRDEVLEAGVSRALGRPFSLPPKAVQ